jgi:beta-lactamase class A
MDALLAGEPGVYGVVVTGPDGQTWYSRNSEVPFVAASLYKLVVMATVYQQETAGTLTLAEPLFVEVAGWVTIDQALFEMIAYSSNEAALALLARVGGVSVVNQTAADLGLDRTQVLADVSAIDVSAPRPAPDTTVGSIDDAVGFIQGFAPEGWADLTTPNDIAAFFSLLLDGQIVSGAASEAMLALLKQQAIEDRIPALLPDGTEVAHKTGNLPQVVHDAGVIYTDAGPVIVAVLSEAMPDEARAASLIQQVALLVYEDQTASPARPNGPENQPPPSRSD